MPENLIELVHDAWQNYTNLPLNQRSGWLVIHKYMNKTGHLVKAYQKFGGNL